MAFRKFTIQFGWQNKHKKGNEFYDIHNIMREGQIRGESMRGWFKLGGEREALGQWEEVIPGKSDLKGVET